MDLQNLLILTTKKPSRIRIVRMRTIRTMIWKMMTMMMLITMISGMTELKFWLMKRNIPVFNQLSGLVSRAEK